MEMCTLWAITGDPEVFFTPHTDERFLLKNVKEITIKNK
jgi:hypothetical protein